jgi:hypothetical protein
MNDIAAAVFVGAVALNVLIGFAALCVMALAINKIERSSTDE